MTVTAVCSDSSVARISAAVVLPTPPLPLRNEMTGMVVFLGSYRISEGYRIAIGYARAF
jgi:hypothetical protein